MSDNDKLNTQLTTPGSTCVQHVHVRPNTIARLTLGCWVDRPGQESMLQLTNPLGQHLAFYVHPDEKKRFLAELRAMLAVWEAQP